MFLNMDMEKAFDKMKWCFLLAIMRKLGFNDRWIGWIESCITSSFFSILINGSPFGLFSPARGLRKGVTPPKLASANPMESLEIYPFKPTCGKKGNHPYKTVRVNAREGE
jgi:hypothetical protein